MPAEKVAFKFSYIKQVCQLIIVITITIIVIII